MRKAAATFGIILLLALGAVAWLMSELNRFRPQVEALIAEQAGLHVEIGGELGWRLLPAPAVTAALVRAADGSWRADEWQYNPIADHHAVRSLHFDAQEVEGICDIEFNLGEGVSAAHWSDAQGIFPVDALQHVKAVGNCRDLRIAFAEPPFDHLDAAFDVGSGMAVLGLETLAAPGGTARARIQVDATVQPLAWTIRFDADSLHTESLQPWLGEDVLWDAEVSYAGEWQAYGKSLDALASSIVGESRLIGGPGRIGAPFIDQIKKAASPFAQGAGKAAPGPVQYQSLAGTWSMEGANQRLTVALDNLALEAEGEYRFAEDGLDVTAKVAVEEGTDDSAFESNPLLTGVRIPLRCAGTLAEPGCKLDGEAVRRLLAEAAEEGSEMQRRVDAIIEESLPPDQRQAARAVLRLLGGSIREGLPE